MIEVEAKSCFAKSRIEYFYEAMRNEKYADSFFVVRNRRFDLTSFNLKKIAQNVTSGEISSQFQFFRPYGSAFGLQRIF